jgi:hypothetical protein
MAKCLRCGAGSEWTQGRVPVSGRDSRDSLRRISKLLKQDHRLSKESAKVLNEIARSALQVKAE